MFFQLRGQSEEEGWMVKIIKPKKNPSPPEVRITHLFFFLFFLFFIYSPVDEIGATTCDARTSTSERLP